MRAIIFTHFDHDILEDVELRNGRANGFGWSTHEVWVKEHGGECMVDVHIADLYCGEPINVIAGYGFRIAEMPDPIEAEA